MHDCARSLAYPQPSPDKSGQVGSNPGSVQAASRSSVAAALIARLAARSVQIGSARDRAADAPATVIGTWLAEGLDQLPLPGGGDTLARWRALAAVGGYDLGVAKLFESHTDALAILAELAPTRTPPHGLGAVWAAEDAGPRLEVADGRLHGRKPWCSGASDVDWALVTAWPAGEQRGTRAQRVLVLVDLHASDITCDTRGWQAVGMASTRTGSLTFAGVDGTVIGPPDAYLDRPGFWHGGIGIAAVWFGAAAALGERVLQCAAGDSHKAMHLGAIDGLLSSTRALLREAAHAVDAAPGASAFAWALRARTVTDDAARRVIDHVGRALGAAPYCTEAAFARQMADLPVFLRQSHAEKDLAALGEQLTDPRPAEEGAQPWQL